MWITLIALAAVAFSLLAQFVWAIQPCILCLYQRGVMTSLAVASLLKWRRITQLISAAGLILALYQVGVEQHWWAHAGCTDNTPPIALEGQSYENQLKILKEHTNKPMTLGCDQVTWRILGVSASVWTVFLYIIINGVAWYGYRKHAPRRSRR